MKILARLISLNPYRQEENLRLSIPFFPSSVNFNARFIRNKSYASLRNSKDWLSILETVKRDKSLYLNLPIMADRLGLEPDLIRSWQSEGLLFKRLYQYATEGAIRELPHAYSKEKVRQLIKNLKIFPIQDSDELLAMREPSGKVILVDKKTKRCWDFFERGLLRNWRGKINGQTVQILQDGRQFTHLKDKTAKYMHGAWKVCKFAEETFSGTKVARLVQKVKNGKDQPENMRRLHERGRKILLAMQGPGVIEHYGDVETKNKRGEPIIVSYQRLCRRGDLFQYLYANSLTIEQKKQIAKDLLRGVEAMHKKGMYHRDLKEENILLDTKEGQPDAIEARLCDFDLGWFEGERLDEYCGTRHAFAPERAAAWKDKTMHKTTTKDLEKNDVWGLGLVLYALYTGKCEYPSGISRTDKDDVREKLAELSKQKGGSFPEPDEPFLKIIWKMLQLDPRDRISISQALKEFERIEANALSNGKPNRVWRWLGF